MSASAVCGDVGARGILNCAEVYRGGLTRWDCGRAPDLRELLASGDPDAVISELMECVPQVTRGRGQREALDALENLVSPSQGPDGHFRYARHGTRDMDRCASL